MLTEDLQIYRDTYKLASMLLAQYQNINKYVRHSVYSDIISASCEACDLVYRANSDMTGRTQHLQRYLEVIGGIRTRVRLLGEQRYVNVKFATNVMYMLDKISKQATGWRNSCAKR